MIEFGLGFLVGVIFSYVTWRLRVRAFAHAIGTSEQWIWDTEGNFIK